MRIAVAFKVTPDFEALRESAWAAAAGAATPVAGETPGVDTRFVRRVLNCFDESALELALRLADQLAESGAAACLEAVTVGGAVTEPYLKTLLALGYEQAARVHTEAALDFAPAVTASLIAAFVARGRHCDVLMTGVRSGPGDSGTVPFRVAEALGWPCLTPVTEVEPLASARLRVTCAAPDGLLRLTVRAPCVLAVGNAVVSHLRVPTLTDRLRRRDTAIGVLDAADLGLDATAGPAWATVAPTGLETVDRSRPGIVVDGASPRDKARKLYDAQLKSLLETP
jgi:electron transfer flavoprotein alpha/beta subunit